MGPLLGRPAGRRQEEDELRDVRDLRRSACGVRAEHAQRGLAARGIAAGNARIQATAATLPILVANNTQSATTAPGENGRLWESFADPALGRQWLWDVPGYVDASGPNPLGFGTRTVSGTTFLITVDGQFPAPGSLGAADYQRARFDLASALLGNGYWGAATSGYDAPLYFDEMDGGALHRRGYLGKAVDQHPEPDA